jgi:hypothetical protein
MPVPEVLPRIGTGGNRNQFGGCHVVGPKGGALIHVFSIKN